MLNSTFVLLIPHCVKPQNVIGHFRTTPHMKQITTLTVLLFFTVLAFGQDFKYVNTETLNVRENAGKQYNVVGQVNKGDKVTAVSENNGWTEIETENGIKGFVATKYLSSDYQSGHSDNGKEKSPWGSILIVLGILGYAGYKVKKFFSGLFGSSSSSSSSYRTPSSTKTTPRETVRTTERVSTSEKQKCYCKCCGREFDNVRDLTSNSCFNSPTKKHQLFEGVVSNKYFCKDCGREFSNLRDLTSNSCFNSPTKKHQPYEGTLKSKYSCKDCGREFSNLRDLTSNSCFNSPTKKHRPAK